MALGSANFCFEIVNMLCYLKKNSYKEFDDIIKFLRLENSLRPHNFSNGPSLIRFTLYEQVLHFGHGSRREVHNQFQEM